MKKLILALVLLSSASVQAADIEACFKINAKTTSKITMNENYVTIQWDVTDDSRSSFESGHVENLKTSDKQISFESFLMGTGDGGSMKIILYKTKISFQGLWADGEPTGTADSYNIVKCK